MGRVRQALKCSSRRTNGEPCKAWAIDGGTVCQAHGGRAPQVRAKAARNVAERKARAVLAGIGDYEPVTDPLSELQRLAGRALRWLDVLEVIVADLNRIRYTTQAEQIDGRIVVFERAMDRLGKLLVDIAHLGIDERLAKISEAQGRLVIEAMLGALTDAGMGREVQDTVRPAIARRLRMVPAAEWEPERLQLAPAGLGKPADQATPNP